MGEAEPPSDGLSDVLSFLHAGMIAITTNSTIKTNEHDFFIITSFRIITIKYKKFIKASNACYFFRRFFTRHRLLLPATLPGLANVDRAYPFESSTDEMNEYLSGFTKQQHGERDPDAVTA
jgi:hypothetical protein